jgi:hypothetical protein
MQWIDKTALDTWAQMVDARSSLIAMVADLIRVTIDEPPTRSRFPSGEAGQLRGWDGDLEISIAKGFVPAGKSKWEFGTGPGEAKATKDYLKRTNQTSDVEMEENTFMLVNLRSWDTPTKKIQEWEADRRAEKKWKDVKYIDGVQLVHWLEQYPAIAARYARNVLKKAPQEGALSTDEYWAEFSSQFEPTLSEKVVIADRKREAEELIARLRGPAGTFMLGGETSEEVVAFAVAAIRCAEPDDRELLQSRTLIISKEAAARFFSMHTRLAFICTGDSGPLAGTLGKNCPTLSAATGPTARRGDFLKRPSALGMTEGFIEMGMEHGQGYELAHRCGRSLTILKRQISNSSVAPPVWHPHTPQLKPAFLAGGWSGDLETDREVLRELGGQSSYVAIETALVQTLHFSDRPVDREAHVWQVRAPVDAFYFYGSQLTDDDLARLQDAVIKVFSKQPEQPSREQKFNQAKAAHSDFSNWLRDGLALTLLIIVTMHKAAGLNVRGKSAQQYVDDVITALPDWGKSHHSLLRLGDQAALFAEAAPNPFLKALESILEGAPEQAAQLFQPDRDFIFGPPSPHVNLLWALETIAWNPRHLNRAAVVLAQLAQLDPDPESNHVNRPINSLRGILLGWSPNTYAVQSQRISCIDEVLRKCPDVGWQLLKKLLPRHSDSSTPTQQPKLQDFAPLDQEDITFGLVWDFESAMIDRALVAAGDDEERLRVFIESFAQFQPQNREKVLSRIDSYLTLHQSEEGCALWHLLKDEASRNEYFNDSDWALSREELVEVKSVIEKHLPEDPLVSDRYAFDDWFPHVGKYDPHSEQFEDPTDLRKEVLQRVLDRDGVPGVLKLAKMVKLPDLLGQTISHLTITIDQMIELLHGAFDSSFLHGLSYFISGAGASKFGDDWKKAFEVYVLTQELDDESRAKLLLSWPTNSATWAYVESLGGDVRNQYWRNESTLPAHAPLDELLFAVEQFRSLGRDIDVLCLLHTRRAEVSSELIIGLLKTSIHQIEQGTKRWGNMLSYCVSESLKELRKRDDVEKLEIATLEYTYLPLLRHEREPLTILSLLAERPDMFVEALSHVFRSKDAPDDQLVTPEMKSRASVSYELLSSFKTVPGLHEGTINFQELFNWVSDARTMAAEKGLGEIGDLRIGSVLAHAPMALDELFWPPSQVCRVIEAVTAQHIERGFSTECFNKRGVFSKGVNEGGEQERLLAAQYKNWADATIAYPRASAMLLAISDSWTRHAEHEDVRAELSKMKS